ncbi:MAG: UDP-N-acetylglucosamine 1-carboxyvinyltransferase [Candidatus Bipolaricaulia bacterium]
MKNIIIHAPGELDGTVMVNGAKNAALPIITASLLTDEPVILNNIPDIGDVRTIVEMLQKLGKEIERIDDGAGGSGRYVIRSRGPLNPEVPPQLVKRMRASFFVLGPLLARLGQARVALPGGCNIGSRPVDLHLKGLRNLGATVELSEGFVHAVAPELSGAEIYLDKPSVGATENIIMTAVITPGWTVISNPASEPEISDLARFLNAMGARIQIRPSQIGIEGVERLHGAEHTIIPDRIEAGTYMIATAIAGGEVYVSGCRPNHLSSVLSKLREVGVEIIDEAGGIWVRQTSRQRLQATDIATLSYPGFPTDLQAPMVTLLSVCDGKSVVKETVFDRRFSHADELNRMGANIQVFGSTAIINGVEKLQGAIVEAPDIRAGAALALAGLAASGTTRVKDNGHIDRGYHAFIDNLRHLGADIEEKQEQEQEL